VVAYFLFLQSLISIVAVSETALRGPELAGWGQALCLNGGSRVVDPEESDKNSAHITHCVLCPVGQTIVGGTAAEVGTVWKVADRVGPLLAQAVATQSIQNPRNARAPPNV
jgi:hypothetical protein